MNAPKQKPAKEWLEIEYCLPPRGKGRTGSDIARELGVHRTVVNRWAREYGINEPPSDRNRYIAKRDGRPGRRIPKPAKDVLANLYLIPPEGQGKSLVDIAELYDVNVITLRRWLQEYGLTQAHRVRQSHFVGGEKNHAYKDGSSRNYHHNVLKKSGRTRKCEWCGATDKLHVHHIDHDVANGELTNLMWLCHYCNILEAQIWTLRKRVQTTFEVIEIENEVRLIIAFRKGKE